MSELQAVPDGPSPAPPSAAELRAKAFVVKFDHWSKAGGVGPWLEQLNASGDGRNAKRLAANGFRDDVLASGDAAIVGMWASMLLDHFSESQEGQAFAEYEKALERLERLEGLERPADEDRGEL